MLLVCQFLKNFIFSHQGPFFKVYVTYAIWRYNIAYIAIYTVKNAPRGQKKMKILRNRQTISTNYFKEFENTYKATGIPEDILIWCIEHFYAPTKKKIVFFCFFFAICIFVTDFQPNYQNLKISKKISKFFFKKIFKKKIEIFFSNQNLDLKVSGAQKDCLENISPKFDRNRCSGTHLIVAQKKMVSKTPKIVTWARSQMRRLYIVKDTYRTR